MEKSELENYCRSFLKEHYAIELSIPVRINGRLTATLGSFIFNNRTNTPIELEFSQKFMEQGGLEDKIKVIKHECIHYALFLIGKPNKDGDPYFESELVKHNSVSSEELDFRIERNVRVYECSCQEHIFKQYISLRRCRLCKQRLVYKEQRREIA